MSVDDDGRLRVGISGAAGRMGRLIAEAVTGEADLELEGLYAPGHQGLEVAGGTCSGDPDVIAGCDVVVEVTRPDVVMGNLTRWRELGVHAVVGTSGFDDARLADLRYAWGVAPPNCLVVPNFSVGAVVMMRLAELAAPHFAAAEVIELHHDRKADAPSGTAVATAERLGRARPEQRREVESSETVPGARGADVSGVPVHAVRLPGLVAHQEVVFGNPGEVLTVRHDVTERSAFVPGVLMAVRRVPHLPDAVTVGLEPLLGL